MLKIFFITILQTASHSIIVPNQSGEDKVPIRITLHPMDDLDIYKEASYPLPLYRMATDVVESREKKKPSKGAYLLGGLVGGAVLSHIIKNNNR